MFRIDKEDNSIKPLRARSFLELGFKERQHLQEWIAKYPSCLGEDLLVIQKEFAGFSDTHERLDLLALDKTGRLVIIENKLDDTGKDVAWQALKYASYCAGLKTEGICGIYQDHLNKIGQSTDASEMITDFLEVADLSEITLNPGVSQRIMLIAANFRKEVTSTVLWLMNFKLQVQCLKVTPWSMAEDLFLNVEQIIPVKDTQDFVIGLADKAQNEVQTSSTAAARNTERREFWSKVIHEMKSISNLYNKISAGERSWLSASSGTPNVGFNFGATGKYCRAEIYIDRSDHAENKFIFDKLFSQKEVLETAFGGPMEWERLNHRRACRIKCETKADMFRREDWPRMIKFMTDAMVRIDKAFREPLQKLNKDLLSGTFEREADRNRL